MEVQIEYTVSRLGYYLTTDLQLTGRGIKQCGSGADHARGKKTYHATEAALKKLKLKYSAKYISDDWN